MLYQMRLHLRPFAQVKEGSKIVEVRLNDPKRQLLRVGDYIEFTSRENLEERTKVQITELVRFSSFKELFDFYPPNEYGSDSTDEYERMYEHYSREDERAYGVLAIKFNKVTN